MNEMKTNLDRFTSLLSMSSSVSYTEAEKRSSEFLVAMAIVAEYKHLLTQEKIKALSIQTAVYAQEMSKGAGKTMTQDKINAEASDEYTKAREDLEALDNDISYLKAHYDIFNNAHIFFRNLAKGDGT